MDGSIQLNIANPQQLRVFVIVPYFLFVYIINGVVGAPNIKRGEIPKKK